jgi:hypothetical protein
MTGFDSKRQAAQNKMNDAADTLSIVYQRGFADGKKAAQRKPLTDEEIRRIKPVSPDFVDFRSGVRCAEAAHNIKQQP